MSDVSTDNSLHELFKCQKLLMDIVEKVGFIKYSASQQDGATARWIEREMEAILKKVGEATNA